MFEDLGLKYVGPVDGHDVARGRARAARAPRRSAGPVIVHVITEKGRGLRPGRAGRRRPVPRGRADPPRDRPAGRAVALRLDRRVRRRDGRASAAAAPTSSRSPRRCSQPVGLAPFAAEFPDARRSTSASPSSTRSTSRRGHGLRRPAPGRRGVRDVPQPRLRPGAHGRRAAPGRRHVRARPRRAHRRRRRRATTACGTWRCSRVVPGLRLAAPRDEETLRDALRTAVDVDDAPTVVRYPKGALVDPVPARRPPRRRRRPRAARRRRGRRARARRRRRRDGADRRWRRPSCSPRTGCASRSSTRAGCCPCPPALAKLVGEHDHVVTLEDGVRRRRRRRRWSAQRAREAGHRRRRCRPSASRARSSSTPRATSSSSELRLRPQDVARTSCGAGAASTPLSGRSRARGAWVASRPCT